MPLLVNVLGTLTAALCAALLLRAYFRVSRRLLLWCGLCFAGLTISNAVLIVDLFVVPAEVSLYRARLLITVASLFVMLYGLIFESDQS
jgi:hypothetical protein